MFLKNITYRLKSRERDSLKVTFNDSSVFLLRDERTICEIRWEDVTSIYSFKFDRITYDPVIVCLVHSPDKKNGTAFEELTEGFPEFVKELNRRYSLDSSWFNKVNEGAFSENYHVLWKDN